MYRVVHVWPHIFMYIYYIQIYVYIYVYNIEHVCIVRCDEHVCAIAFLPRLNRLTVMRADCKPLHSAIYFSARIALHNNDDEIVDSTKASTMSRLIMQTCDIREPHRRETKLPSHILDHRSRSVRSQNSVYFRRCARGFDFNKPINPFTSTAARTLKSCTLIQRARL